MNIVQMTFYYPYHTSAALAQWVFNNLLDHSTNNNTRENWVKSTLANNRAFRPSDMEDFKRLSCLLFERQFVSVTDANA